MIPAPASALMASVITSIVGAVIAKLSRKLVAPPRRLMFAPAGIRPWRVAWIFAFERETPSFWNRGVKPRFGPMFRTIRRPPRARG